MKTTLNPCSKCGYPFGSNVSCYLCLQHREEKEVSSMLPRSRGMQKEMNKLEQELFDYIKNRKYYCCYCAVLKAEVLAYGLQEIDNYKGMICGSIEDMIARYNNVKNGLRHDTPETQGRPLIPFTVLE